MDLGSYKRAFFITVGIAVFLFTGFSKKAIAEDISGFCHQQVIVQQDRGADLPYSDQLFADNDNDLDDLDLANIGRDNSKTLSALSFSPVYSVQQESGAAFIRHHFSSEGKDRISILLHTLRI